MLRLNKNRRKSTKGKQSSKEHTVEKTNSRPYEENYNEVILNDLVPEEKRSELGLQSEAPKNNKKKSSGLNLNFGLGTKKSKKSKESVATEKTKESSKNKSGNKQQSSSKNEKAESKPSKGHKDSQATTDKTKSSNKKNKVSDESKQSKASKGNEKSSNSKLGKQKTKSSKGSKATKSDVVDQIEEQNVSKEEVKKTPRPIVNPKRRRRQEQEQTDNSRSSDEEVKLDVEEISQEDSDSVGFRNLEEENKVEEIEPVKSKFEDLVWSEDKFPKK